MFREAQSTEETGQHSETEPTQYSLSIRYLEERGTVEKCSESVRSRLARGRCRKVLEGRKLFYRENILVITWRHLTSFISFINCDLTTVMWFTFNRIWVEHKSRFQDEVWWLGGSFTRACYSFHFPSCLSSLWFVLLPVLISGCTLSFSRFLFSRTTCLFPDLFPCG